jgi:hypothetical protein
MHARILLAAIATFAGTSAAFAFQHSSGQTAEGAQAFLSMQFPPTFSLPPAQNRILSARYEPDGNCAANVHHRIEAGVLNNGRVETVYRESLVRLSWADVLEVNRSDGEAVITVRSRGPHGPWSLAINVQSADLAARVAYAMEFLRRECDPSQQTGF